MCIKTFNPKTAKGNVEVWLAKTEEVMIASLVDLTHKSIEDYPLDWILAWPGQIILSIDQLFWTAETEDYLSNVGLQGVKTYADICTQQMLNVVNLVRGDLSKNHRITLGSLVTLDLHGRDVLQDELYKEGVDKPMDFSWLAQLRYYFNRGQGGRHSRGRQHGRHQDGEC